MGGGGFVYTFPTGGRTFVPFRPPNQWVEFIYSNKNVIIGENTGKVFFYEYKDKSSLKGLSSEISAAKSGINR
jgi:hypothetical protein